MMFDSLVITCRGQRKIWDQ